MSEFLRSDPELERKLAACNDPSNLRQIVTDHYARNGVIRCENGDGYGIHFIGQPSVEHRPPVVQVSAGPAPIETFSRVIYPHGNDRFEIFGVSEADLDEKERQLRSMY